MTLKIKQRKFILLAYALVATLFCLGFPPAADAKYASYVIDFETGDVLHAVNENTRNYPASLTKLMTLYLVFEQLEKKKWSLQTPLTISRRAARQPASKLGLKPGRTIPVKQAILALITKSANDVATVIAENISGSERDFALHMTAKARAIGMHKTTFRNASGLPHRGQLSTARDMSILAQKLLLEYPRYYTFFSTKYFSYKGRNFKNHNKLLKTYTGADGIKTGYIRASGYNLVVSATRNGQRVIGVIFGGKTARQRNTLMTRLLNKSFSKITTGTHYTADVKPTLKKTRRHARKTSHVSYWGIQVGAFARQKQAVNAARQALKSVPQLLHNGEIKISPLKKKNGRKLYRARIIGIEKHSAFRACKLIKDCMELKITANEELASR